MWRLISVSPADTISFLILYPHFAFNLSLPPTNEVCGKVMFLHLPVCPQRGGGVMMSLPVMDRTPPGQQAGSTHSLECFLVTTRKRSLGQGNAFTPVCDSVYRGVLPHCMLGYTPQGRHPPGRPPLGRHLPSGQTPHP